MKKLILSLLTVGMFLSAPSISSAELADVCPTIRELGKDQYKNNSPIRASGLGSPITRFAHNPTIIFIRTNPAKFSFAKAYDASGQILLQAPRLTCAASPRAKSRFFRGECLSRYKANEVTSQTEKMRRLAVKRSGKPEIYWKVNKDLCIRVPDIGRCYNVKVRDLCDGRVLK